MTTKPVSVGECKPGKYVVIDGAPCVVKTVQTSKPGKHGHAKCRVEAVGIIDGVKRIFVKPAHDTIDAPMVERLVQEQRDIVKASLKFLKNGGHFVYATCSLLSKENEDQVEYFLKNHPLVLEREQTLHPEEGGMDGFFAAVFKKRDVIESHTL